MSPALSRVTAGLVTKALLKVTLPLAPLMPAAIQLTLRASLPPRGNCSPRPGDLERQRTCLQRQGDGAEGRDGAPPCGFDDGPYVGAEFCAPFGPKAVGDFAEGDAWPQGPFGPVVGGGQSAVGDGNEQIAPDFSDDSLAPDLIRG